jgi:hypothetical protein
MKVQFKNLLKAYSGHCDGLVYYYNPLADKMVCRRYVKPRASQGNARFIKINRRLKEIFPSPEYLSDLKYYAALASDHTQHLNWRNVYLKMMFALQRDFGIDLATITREQIFSQNLPCKSVKSAVDAGLLAPVVGYQRMSAEM